jgi:hypothetical protein
MERAEVEAFDSVFLAAQEIETKLKARPRETRHIEAFEASLRRRLTCLRRLAEPELRVYRKAIEDATSFRPNDLEGLSGGMESMLDLLAAAKDGSLGDEEERTLLTFIRSLRDQCLEARTPA